ncbi:hypothetical protein ACS15_0196 [Ralstonia insidiosa]|uniref:Uncharacterized protein n=1 Tax=Ralstonia insidiosa TaxID=190721 RepID=A0AAC9BDN6_9RALS|nr:hypothetical protein ACS15_0196 [Ralstonia insidiosa]
MLLCCCVAVLPFASRFAAYSLLRLCCVLPRTHYSVGAPMVWPLMP